MLDLQKTRHRWKVRTVEKEAFGNLASHPHNCYTYNHGGRNEAHFNISIHPVYFSIGLGFEFTIKKGGDPTAVHLAYACFAKLVRNQQHEFERFVTDNLLEIEWAAMTTGALQYVPTREVVSWILKPPQEPMWICVCRTLRRDRDAATLENPNALGDIIEKVFSGFRPLWERTEILAHT